MTKLDWKISKALRRMQRRREKCTAIRVATKLFAVSILTASAVMFSGAYSQPTETVSTEYTVKKGDTFWSIAEMFRTMDKKDPYILEYIENMKRLNPEFARNGYQVHPGQILRVEYEVRR